MKQLFILLLSIQLTACASIVSGATQPISIDTEPASARCELKNDKGVWHVSDTPASVVVHRSYEDLRVTCNKGSMSGAASFKSTTKAMAFGNILVGGAIGAGVDASTGAAYDYPDTMTVRLK